MRHQHRVRLVVSRCQKELPSRRETFSPVSGARHPGPDCEIPTDSCETVNLASLIYLRIKNESYFAG
jgi:hypothetical protein